MRACLLRCLQQKLPLLGCLLAADSAACLLLCLQQKVPLRCVLFGTAMSAQLQSGCVVLAGAEQGWEGRRLVVRTFEGRRLMGVWVVVWYV